jgi:RNA polymerase sigma-70 factor, ECF subfamily
MTGRQPRLPIVNPHRRFEALVMPHLAAGYNLARWLARDAHDADDVVQEACMRALRYIGSLDGADARPWFLTIVRRAFYDWLERNRPAEALDGARLDALVDPGDDPERLLARQETAIALADAVGALPLPYREVLVLRELEDLSYKEIAQVAAIPIGTVMSRLARARALLQRSPLLQAVREANAGMHG